MSKRSRSSSDQQAKRRKVKHTTYNSWITQYDREYQTVTWLDCETHVEDGTKVVTQLKCRVCTKFKERISGRKNYSEKWITGANSVRTTNLVDHAKSEQHIHAMNLLRKEQAQAQGAPAAAAYNVIDLVLVVTNSDRLFNMNFN